MTGWLVMRVLCCFYFTGTLTTLALGFAAVYSEDARPARHIHPGRRFGGYRIVPKSCKDLTSQGKARGICMFNYECVQMGGSVVGSCMDGFLYGACCKLPPGVVYSGIEIPSTTPTTTSSKPIPPQVQSVKPLTSHPIGDTILFHKNGSVVQDVNSPEEFDLLKNPPTGGYVNTPFPELSTFSYISGPGGIVSASGSFPVKRPEEDQNPWPSKTPQYSPTETAPFTSSMQITTRKETESLPSTTTKYSSFTKPFSNKVTYPSNSYPYITKPSDSYTYNHIMSGSPYKDTTPYYNLVTKPGYLTSNNIPHKVEPTTPLPLTSAIDKYHTDHYHLHEEDNMVLVQTIDVNKPDVEDATNVASINHILSILNETGPSPEPIPTSPSLSTWVSINGKPDKTSAVPVYSSSNHYYTTKQPTSSGATIQHVAGPSFQVTPQVNITPKPQASTTPEPAPTVIVLGPLNPQSTKKPTRKPIQTYTTPSYNLKPTHTVTVLSSPEHSTVVTLKPDTSVISVNPPHLSYVTHRPTWTTVTPLYHSESHVSVSHSTYTTKPPYTATKPVHHSKPQNSQDYSTSKPIIYSTANKPAVYTTAKPAVYSSSKPGVSASHKPIVYTTAYPASQTKPIYQSTLSNTKPVHTTYVSNRPVSTNRPVYTTTKPTFIRPTQQDVSNSTEDLVAFPPVRDPNITLIIPQHEKPGFDQLTSVTTLDDETQSTPQFVVDENLDNKVHGFVEKIVQSLEGNFVDLENVLLDGQRRPNITLTQKPVKKPTTPTTSSTTTRRPTKKPVKKPASSSTVRPTASKPSPTNKPSSSIIVSTYRPKPQESTTTITIKPSKKPSAPPTLILFQPSTTILTTTVSPTPSTTKRPKPIKRPPSTIESIDVVEEGTEVTSQTTTTTPKPTTEVNYKKECGVRPLMKNGRIVGGKGATFGEWPWQVLVREATWLGLFTKNKCGGVLITSRYVITAAHCQPGFLASLVAVFGEYDISGEVESKRSVSKNVRRVIVHRQYDAATFENDIALLELDSPVQFDTHIVPICMPKDDEDFTGRMATVTGWGRLKYGGGVPSVLQEVQVPVMENNVCQEMFHTAGHSKSIISSFLCAGYANGQRDSCEGDSGGPLMVEREDGRWVLAGTVSHGIKCAAPYLPGVYMRTTYYKPWLQTITGVRSL